MQNNLLNKTNDSQQPKQNMTLLLAAFAAGTLVLDQVTKAAARLYISSESAITIIPGFADLRLSFNRGAAFGLLPSFAPLFIVMAIVVVYAIWRLRHVGTIRPLAIGLGLLMGGALGNVIDRIVTPGRGVTDFIDLHLGSAASALSWPTFNLADAALVIGMLLTVLFAKIHSENNQPEDCDPKC